MATNFSAYLMCYLLVGYQQAGYKFCAVQRSGIAPKSAAPLSQT
jgi:hypothetical protein